MRTTCKDVLYKYIKENEGFHKKVDLYSIAEDWSPETVGRDLRSLKEENKIKVDYYDGKYAKGLVKYALLDYQITKPKIEYIEKDGIVTVIYI